jgi:FkbM family methyltransferase
MALAEVRHEIGRRVRNLRRDRIAGVGHDFVGDIKTRLPHVQVNTIFDVGAHIGLTALEFSDEFPNATVYAFEPGSENFCRMKSNLIGKPDIRLHNIGFSSAPGEAVLLCEPEHPSMARIVSGGTANTETVKLDTIDNFSIAAGVNRIDLLKIDVEGHEMSVFAGARKMLEQGRISIIRFETAIDPDLDYHTQFFEAFEFLRPFGYRLFGFYDQWENMLADSPALRRFDAAVISRAALQRSAQSVP